MFPLPVIGSFLFCMLEMFVPHMKYMLPLPEGQIYILYADVRTSQETHASTAYYRDRFTFHMLMMLVPHRKHMPLNSCYREISTFLYAGNFRTSQ
jgi:hypothetical protein